MDFLFHVPFFSALLLLQWLRFDSLTVLTVCFVNIEFRDRKKFSFRENIISRVLKLPESTQRKQAIFNKDSLL
jgi:hypothetical protein